MWISNVSIVLPDRILAAGSLRIEDGCITEIVENAPNENPDDGGQTNLVVLPGIVDLHGDMLEREIEPRPGALFPIDLSLIELDKRLASAGVTTAFAAVSFWESERRRLRTDKNAVNIIETIVRLRPHLLVDFCVHARYEISTPVVAPSVRHVIERGWVQLVSLMDHTPGQGQYRDMERYYDFMAKWVDKSRDEVVQITQKRLAGLPPETEIWQAANQIAGLARQHGLPLASHDDDTPEKVSLVTGLGATLSEFPVSLEAAQAARRHGMNIIMGAPNALRDESTSGNLTARQGLAAGVTDILAADYHPASLLHAAWELAQAGVLPLYEAVNLISRNPAEAVGLHDRGGIAVGKRADLVVVEAGLLPRVRTTFRCGVPIYDDHQLARKAQPFVAFSHAGPAIAWVPG
ncbi:MAG: alpha-D-ribose 1-methylphosphonate 5-triphosphate diphosphatase [Chloroflexota bacterium]